MNSRVRRVLQLALLIAFIVNAFLVHVGGQEYPLPKMSPELRALTDASSALLMSSMSAWDPAKIDQHSSPDAMKLETLDQAATSASGDLRAIADLLSVYENLQSETDRTTVKPLLDDRLRLYSRLLGFEAEKAALPLGSANQPATTKRALKLRDDILAAKAKLDSIAASLK